MLRRQEAKGSTASALAAPVPVAGFEATGYAWQGGQIVWVGKAADGQGAEHPRNLRRPWHAEAALFDAARLHGGARCALELVRSEAQTAWPGLLAWLAGRDLPFPLAAALPCFEALRRALAEDDPAAFAAAAPRVLGLGPGLTPSGDDFLGGVFFSLAHAPRARWAAPLPAMHASLLAACATATNAISAALLADCMQGRSYRVLHELLAVLQGQQPAAMRAALRSLAGIGATSGGDLAAGVFVALATSPTPPTSPSSSIEPLTSTSLAAR